MSDRDLNPESDLDVDLHDLTGEFKKLSLTLYRYYTEKTSYERKFDDAKANYDLIKAQKYKELKSDTSRKLTEAGTEAEIETMTDVISIRNAMLDAKQELGVIVGAVESLKAKKDMLIQLGSDRRKESL